VIDGGFNLSLTEALGELAGAREPEEALEGLHIIALLR